MNMAADKTVLIMAGGTGGHIFPALSIARQLQSSGIKVEWLGTRKGMEARLIPPTGIPIHYISVSGLRGKNRLSLLLSPFVIVFAICQAMLKIISSKPCCVLGMGGFVTGPGGVAAWLLRKPLLIHEQNAIAGLSNQLLSSMASTVMEGFAGAFERKRDISNSRWLKKLTRTQKTVYVGNPLRDEILHCPAPQQRFADTDERDSIRLLVIGGSLGAVAINRLMPEFLCEFPQAGKIELWHQCGKQNLESCRAYYAELGIEENELVRISAFIDDMAAAYCWADVVICRAGASTVSEIAAIGIPAVFVPFPYAVDDHQTENALILQKLGAAWIVQQSELNPLILGEILNKFLDDRSMILRTAQLARQAARPDATETAANYCLEACHG